MDMNVGVHQETQQSLLISRQAIQAIQILGYSQDDLEAFLQDQLDRNPLLRIAADPPTASSPELKVDIHPPARTADFTRSGVNIDVQSLGGTLHAKTYLREHLHQQVAILKVTPLQRAYVECLIDSLEPDGYLRSRLDDLADLLDAPLGALEDALQTVQTFDPVGVAARDLKECLWLQLREKGQLDPIVETLLANLELVEKGDFKRLSKRCGITMGMLADLLQSLRRLDPKPGHRFNTDIPLPALPDILVSIVGSGRVRVEINPELLPRVLLDREYFTELSTQLHQNSDRNYLQNCLREANALIHNLNQRTQTTLKIATEIIRNQTDFLYHGDAQLRPLSQKDIAQAVGVHESTVSRAIANKYLLCPQGQISLKYFFSDGLSARDGNRELAATAIRHRIKDIVSRETQDYVLSDEDIVGTLQNEGVEIARRTVAKYRGQLRIPSSAQRSRHMQLTQHGLG